MLHRDTAKGAAAEGHRPFEEGSREDIKLALLDFAPQYSVLARETCFEWASILFRWRLPNEVSGAVLGCVELKSLLMDVGLVSADVR